MPGITIRVTAPEGIRTEMALEMASAVRNSWCAIPLEEGIRMLCFFAADIDQGAFIIHTQACVQNILARKLYSGRFSEEVRRALELREGIDIPFPPIPNGPI